MSNAGGTNTASSSGESGERSGSGSGGSGNESSSGECAMSEEECVAKHASLPSKKKTSLLAQLTKPPRSTNTSTSTSTGTSTTAIPRKFALSTGKENLHKPPTSASTTAAASTTSTNALKRPTFFSKLALQGLSDDSEVSEVDACETRTDSDVWIQSKSVHSKSSDFKGSALTVVPTVTKTSACSNASTHGIYTGSAGHGNSNHGRVRLPKSPLPTEKMEVSDLTSPIDWGF
eukprot:GDKK01046955.1.p1 GENE.GDKK01046955.1~~GDKK01046955.1.p1  ORF type:complete len:232 (+),score=16.24 GDKK01046955.1:399-1094(+)